MQTPSLTACLLRLTNQLAGVAPLGDTSSTYLQIARELAEITQVDCLSLLWGGQFLGWHGASSEDRALVEHFFDNEQRAFLDHQQPVLLDEPWRQYFSSKQPGRRTRLASVMLVPMIYSGQPMGHILAGRNEISAFRDIDKEVLGRAARFLAQDIEQHRLYWSSSRDSVTQFLHRQAMMDLLGQEILRCKRYQAPLSVLMMDIDGYHQLQNNSSSEIDAVLKKIAVMISSESRQTDWPARIDSNAFVIVQPMTSGSDAHEAATRLMHHFSDFSVTVQEMPIRISWSMGVASLRADEDDVISLLIRADQVLCAAKKMGGNRIMTDDKMH